MFTSRRTLPQHHDNIQTPVSYRVLTECLPDASSYPVSLNGASNKPLAHNHAKAGVLLPVFHEEHFELPIRYASRANDAIKTLRPSYSEC